MTRTILILRKLCLSLMLTTLFCAMDGHILVLQSWAWGQMIWQMTKTDSMRTAVHKTFDGRHLCPICLALKARKAQQPQWSALGLQKHLEATHEEGPEVTFRWTPDPHQFLAQKLSFQARPGAGPPKPPPKAQA